MSVASDLRAMRDYIAEYGFAPVYGSPDGPCCFLGAHDYAVGGLCGMLEGRLCDGGWKTRDALAVLDIAADCAEAEGR